MVLLHTLRSFRSIYRGTKDRAAVLEAHKAYLIATGQSPTLCTKTGEHLLPVTAESKCTLYMGLRMTDMFGHINNARYIEAMELARWHQMGTTGLWPRAQKARLFPVVAGVDVQYLREIKPCTTVVVRSRFCEGTGLMFQQQIESVKGDVIHATGLVRFAWLNKPDYKLPDGSKPKPGPVPPRDAMLRLGFPVDAVDNYFNGVTVTAADNQYFGKPVSSYDKKLQHKSGSEEEVSALQKKVGLAATFDPDAMAALGSADTAWRNILRKEVKARKELFPRKEATSTKTTATASKA